MTPTRLLNSISTWYLDADGDGLGSTTITFQGCSNDALNPGSVRNTIDCDDNNPDPHKARTEWCRDNDSDGYRGACPPGYHCESPGSSYPLPKWAPVDCDDANPQIPAVQSCP